MLATVGESHPKSTSAAAQRWAPWYPEDGDFVVMNYHLHFHGGGSAYSALGFWKEEPGFSEGTGGTDGAA